MDNIKKIVALLTVPEKKQAVALMGMNLVMAVLDMLGVASIMPFIAVLASPDIIESNSLLSYVFEASRHVGVATADQFLFLLGIIVFMLLVVSLSFKAITTYLQIRFVMLREYSVGKRLVEGYLHQPYSWFLSRHSADLSKTILSEVQIVVNNGMLPLMTILSQGTVVLGLLIVVVMVDPVLAFNAGVVLGLTYAGIFVIMSRFLRSLGEARLIANQKRFVAVNDAFSAAKEVKVRGLEHVYGQRFSTPAENYAKGQSMAQIVAQLPRYVLEALAFGGMLLVLLYLMAKNGSLAAALPITALYAITGYRLLPALQQIYGGFALLRFVGPSLETLHNDLSGLQPVSIQKRDDAQMILTQGISLAGVTYCYPNAVRPALSEVDLCVAAHSLVGVVGATGSGKTTIIDLILGLLEPQNGSLAVDGRPITDVNRRNWQRAIGYVPQQVYLSDSSVAENIAFGIDVAEIDHSAVERASKIANLHEFVVNNLPEAYATNVGERGARLSGGQRQRIGIARALYHNPQVLIFDEATSALDSLTEQAVMDAVHNLGRDVTIIMIAHRLSTVRQCDQIYLLDNGKVVAQGRFDDLVRSNEQFRALAVS